MLTGDHDIQPNRLGLMIARPQARSPGISQLSQSRQF